MYSAPAVSTVLRRRCQRQVCLLFATWVALLLAPAFAAQAPPGLRQAAGNVAFEYGLMPAAALAGHLADHVESKMHGGPQGRTGSHLVVALFDKATGDRIVDAVVSVSITPLGASSVSKNLEPMTVDGLASYGGYVSLARPGVYRIRFEARRPGVAGVAWAEFEHRVAREGGGR